MSAIFGIHLVSTVFIAFFMIDGKPVRIVLGILSKDLSTTLVALWATGALQELAAPPSAELTVVYIETTFAVYALIWLLVLYLAWRRGGIRGEPYLELAPDISGPSLAGWAVIAVAPLSLWAAAKDLIYGDLAAVSA